MFGELNYNKLECIAMTWDEIYNRFDAVLDYSLIIAELKASGEFEGSRRNQLPTFEYFYNNCVLDKGGKYDFTMLRYKSETGWDLPNFNTNPGGINPITNKKAVFQKRWSYWMGTPFGVVEMIELK